MEKLVCGDHPCYAPHATSRKDYPSLTIERGPSYSADNHEIYFESVGPAGGGPYTLLFELNERQLKHAHGPYEDQTGSGLVEDIEFPPG
jgi:hypothetical protein